MFDRLPHLADFHRRRRIDAALRRLEEMIAADPQLAGRLRRHRRDGPLQRLGRRLDTALTRASARVAAWREGFFR